MNQFSLLTQASLKKIQHSEKEPNRHTNQTISQLHTSWKKPSDCENKTPFQYVFWMINSKLNIREVKKPVHPYFKSLLSQHRSGKILLFMYLNVYALIAFKYLCEMTQKWIIRYIWSSSLNSLELLSILLILRCIWIL